MEAVSSIFDDLIKAEERNNVGVNQSSKKEKELIF